MPTYRITDPQSGRTIRVDGPSPPPENIVRQMFEQANQQPPSQAPPTPQRRLTMDEAVAAINKGETERTQAGVRALPTIGGMAGSLVGGIPGAAIGGAVGEAARQVQMKGDPSVPTETGAQARDIALSGALQGGLEAAGTGILRGIGNVGSAVYRGYLKPSIAAKNVGKANEIVETAIREGLPITTGGTQKANRLISELNQEVNRLLNASPESIDLKRVADRVRDFVKRRYFRAGADMTDYQAALAVADRLDSHPALGIAPGAVPASIDVPVADANQAKRAMQSSVSASYGTPNAGAVKTAGKEAAREMRVAIEGKVPQVGPLNAREAKLIDAARAINQAVNREANQNALVGVKSLASASVVGGGAYSLSGDPWSSAALAMGGRLALTPAVMSRAAIVASRLGRTSGAAPANVARVAIITALEGSEGAE